MRRVGSLLLLSAVIAAPVSASDAPSVHRIVVEDRGPGTVDESYVLAHIRSRAGQPLDRRAVARDQRALMDTGRFSDVRVEVARTGKDVALVFGVTGRWRLQGRPTVSGSEHFRLSKIHDWLQLYPGDYVDDHVVGAKTRQVVKEYRADHYPDARVTWQLDAADEEAGLATLSIAIEEGTRTKVKRFEIRGNERVGTRDLLDTVGFRKWWNPLRFWRTMDYEGADLLMYRVALRDAYLERGFLDAQVSLPRVVMDAKGRPAIDVSVIEGVRYVLGDLTVSGVTRFPEQEVMNWVRGQKGRVASSTLMASLRGAIRDFYGSRGYIQTRVRAAPVPHPDKGLVDICFHVTEGELTYIRNIVINGNGRTKDKVIRRELTVVPGDIYDEVQVRRSKRILQNLGYFSRVDSFPVSTDQADRKDLHLEVEEKSTGQFMIGAGYSSEDKAIGFVELSQGNFDILSWPYPTGGGQKLKLRTQFADTRTDVDLSFVEPWFLDRKLQLSVDLFRSEVEFTDYDITRKGFAVGLTKSIPWNNRVQLKYRLEQSDITDVSDTNEYVVVDTGESYFFSSEEGKTLQSSMTLALSHDTRNSSFIPSRGAKARLAYTLYGGPLGGDDELYEVSFKGRQYFNPWWNHVISLRARYAVIEAYGDTDDVGLRDRFFLGGARNLRGYDYRDVGPKVTTDEDADTTTSYRPLGGQSLGFASLEYTFPLAKHIRFATFYDIGNVWMDPYELDLDELASSAGVGIRLDIPGFPIRIDRSWAIDPDDDLTDEEEWSFWIGYDFY